MTGTELPANVDGNRHPQRAPLVISHFTTFHLSAFRWCLESLVSRESEKQWLAEGCHVVALDMQPKRMQMTLQQVSSTQATLAAGQPRQSRQGQALR